jgi:hypothetical protein
MLLTWDHDSGIWEHCQKVRHTLSMRTISLIEVSNFNMFGKTSKQSNSFGCGCVVIVSYFSGTLLTISKSKGECASASDNDNEGNESRINVRVEHCTMIKQWLFGAVQYSWVRYLRTTRAANSDLAFTWSRAPHWLIDWLFIPYLPCQSNAVQRRLSSEIDAYRLRLAIIRPVQCEENWVRLHLRPFQVLGTVGMDFDIVVIIICGSISNEYLVMQATQPKERWHHVRGGIV